MQTVVFLGNINVQYPLLGSNGQVMLLHGVSWSNHYRIPVQIVKNKGLRLSR